MHPDTFSCQRDLLGGFLDDEVQSDRFVL